MANWARGLASGLETGVRIGDVLEQRRQREELAKAYGLAPQEQQAPLATPEQLAGAQAETRALAAQDAEMFGLAPQDMQRYAPAMPQEGARTGMSTYRLGEQVLQRAPTQAEIDAARTRAAADVYGRYGDTARREELLRGLRAEERAQAEQEFQAQYRPMLLEQAQLGLAGKRREERKVVDFDTGYAELSRQEFETPEAKTAALLSLVERTQGLQAAQQLRSNYTTNELNTVRLQAEKFDTEYKQARQKGVDAALEWFDKQNAAFTLEKDPKNPFRVIQVNTDGSRQLFADARNERELGMAIDARAKPGGWLELAKYDLDTRNTESLIAYRNAAAKEAADRSGAAANALSGVQLGYTRGPNGQLVQVMSGVRFNKRTGDMETVQVPLDQNIIPTSALDPAKIAKQAEELIGTPIDPTNKKGPAHTAQSARQAVTDQIINQYLGTGDAGPDLSPQELAQRIKNQAAPAAPQERPAPAPRQPATVGIDTGRPSTNINPVTGLPRETPVQAPNLVAAASRGLSAAESNYKAYLQGKLDRNEKLTVDEQMRARRFGLQ